VTELANACREQGDHKGRPYVKAQPLLKPHAAPGGGCSGHLKLPAKLPRETLNES